jgi:type I restriction enzyme, S subunit
MSGLNLKVNLPDKWEVSTLRDICSKIVDGSHNPPKKQLSGLPMLSAVNINNNKVEFTDYRLITEDDFNSENKRTQIETGDVLLTIVGAIGRTAVVLNGQRKFTLQRSVAVLKPIEMLSKFLMYQLESPAIASYFDENAKGTAQKGIYLQTLGQMQLAVSPLNEQHRIVSKIEELFSEIDKGVESLKTAKAQLQVYRQALLKHAFEGKLTAQWRSDNPDKVVPAAELLRSIEQAREERYQQQLTDWQTAVEKWEFNGAEDRKPGKPKLLPFFSIPSTEDFRDITSTSDGLCLSALGNLIDEPKYGTSKKCSYESQGIGVLRIPNIEDNKIDATDLKFADFDDAEIRDYSLQKNDLLIIRSNGSISLVGKCAQISDKDTEYLYAGYLIRLRPNPLIINAKYLTYILSSHFLRQQIESKAKSTSGVNNINSGEIQSLLIPIHSINEQIEISRLLDQKITNINSIELDIENSLNKAEMLRQSILKKAFSGQLVPQDPTDETASELLKRIQAEKAQRETTTKTKRKSTNLPRQLTVLRDI